MIYPVMIMAAYLRLDSIAHIFVWVKDELRLIVKMKIMNEVEYPWGILHFRIIHFESPLYKEK